MDAKLVVFIYLLLRNYVTVGEVDCIMRDVEATDHGDPQFDNRALMNMAEAYARRVSGPMLLHVLDDRTKQMAHDLDSLVNDAAKKLQKLRERLDHSTEALNETVTQAEGSINGNE
jgi:hypothetical protein